MIKILSIYVLLLSIGQAQADSSVTTQSLHGNPNSAAEPADFMRGKQLWHQSQVIKGQPRSCTTCHGSRLDHEGKHVRTGKVIKAMSPQTNPQRLSDPARIEKWFKRNCKWTWGRECSNQEKADILLYIDQYATRAREF